MHKETLLLSIKKCGPFSKTHLDQQLNFKDKLSMNTVLIFILCLSIFMKLMKKAEFSLKNFKFVKQKDQFFKTNSKQLQTDKEIRSKI